MDRPEPNEFEQAFFEEQAKQFQNPKPSKPDTSLKTLDIDQLLRR